MVATRDSLGDVRLQTATLESAAGMRASVLNLGATLRSLQVPTAEGPVDVILGYPADEDYATDAYYMGSTVGPFANRIRDARFAINGKEYTLDANEASTGHCLHGGEDGLHRQLFDMDVDADGTRITCRRRLPAGLGGFPGNRSISVTYEVLDRYALALEFSAITDRDTVISLANHAYFNLGGMLDDHEIRICADAYTPTHASNVPTGEIGPVNGTPFDLREMRRLGDTRFDHNFVLPNGRNEPRLVAQLRSPATAVQLNLYTTQSGLQLYTGDYLDTPFVSRQGLCLEAQGFPDAPNQPEFPSALLKAGARYWQRTVYEFDVVNG